MNGQGEKIVVYSAYYGDPEPYNPEVFGPALGKYPCLVFSDNPSLVVPKGVTLCHDPLGDLDVNRASRRAKLMPHLYLPRTDRSIYVDNNARLLVSPEALLNRLAANAGHPPAYAAAFRHPERDCLYEEAAECAKIGKDDPEILQRQIDAYRAAGMPDHAGLFFCALMVRDHRVAGFSDFGNAWFAELLKHSRRDQVSFPYVAWKLGLSVRPIPGNLLDGEILAWPVFASDDRRDESEMAKRALRPPWIKRRWRVVKKHLYGRR